MLSGNNGILQKTTDAKIETGKGEVYEQISLATASGEMEYYSKGTNRLTSYKNALLNGVDGIDIDNLTDNGSNLITGTVTAKSGKQYDFSVPVPVTDIIVAEHTEQERPESTIDYGEKTAETVIVGDDITIGTEKFKVIKKSEDGKLITAMPYYNITLADTPIQSSSSGKIAFSSDSYWTEKGVDINMTEKNADGTYKNRIQQYVEAYQRTLEELGANNVTTRIAIYSELDGMNSSLHNPGQAGAFWLGTSGLDSAVMSVYRVDATGNCWSASYTKCYTSNYAGVRPLIEITL